MFKRRKTNLKALQVDTLIGAGTRILGDIQFTGGLHVDGSIQGSVEAQAGVAATLSISDSGQVEGSVSAPHVVLNGSVLGDIVATERVELGATAKVTGNVYYGLIEMASGAQINGKLIHQPSQQAAPKAASVSADVATPLSSAAG
jgi:cytoskeletal protein CcmA (bactofilin family)